MKAHLLFEQSGTFKNAFKKNGIEAFDYDILNDFGETDFQVDLFGEIQKAFEGGQSVFDNIAKEDVCFAFFPCIRFDSQISMSFRGDAKQQKKWSNQQKIEYSMKLHDELHYLYKKLCELVLICIEKELKIVIENPYTQPHYLSTYWCLKPVVIDKDRTVEGDFYKKPTQYFFLNIEPKNNLIFEPIECVEKRTVEGECSAEHSMQVRRSMIHPQYADRFIRKYIL